MSNETIVGGGTIDAARSVAALAGNALKTLRCNAGETATEWATAAGGGDLLAANNLSDVDDAQTALTNLTDGNQGVGFRVENLTSDPVTPLVGQIWFRTDL